MLLSAIALTVTLLPPQQAKVAPTPEAKPVTLARVFTKGEKLQYAITSNLHTEARQYGLQTFIPDDLDLSYKFTSEVKDLKSDGVAVLRYARPNIVAVEGATAERPSKTTVDKIDWIYDLTVSPINAILEEKDLNPKKPPKKKSDGDDGGDGGLKLFAHMPVRGQDPLGGMMGQFIGELYRLSLNIGSMDSALDFSPKLPLDEVKVGDTWKQTVSYEPQTMKGKNGKQAVQRLDYTFTYRGLVTVSGKQYHRVSATLDLNTDLGSFINQLLDAKPSETHLKGIPLKLKQKIDFDLDMANKRTVAAHSAAEGGFNITITDTDEPLIEEKLTGTTDMHLVAIGVSAPTKTVAKHGSGGHRP